MSYLIWCLKATNKHPDVLRREGWTEKEIADVVGVTYIQTRAEHEAQKEATKQGGKGMNGKY